MLKRSDIDLTNTAVIKYCKNENKMQLYVYPKKIDKSMTAYQANFNFTVITEVRKMAEALDRRGIEFNDLLKMIEAMPMKRRSEQTKLVFTDTLKKESTPS